MVTQMDYDRVGWLRRQTDTAAQSLTRYHDGQDLEASAQVAPSAFGNTSGGSGCGAIWQQLVDSAGTARANLYRTVLADRNRIVEVVRIFRSTDHESADRICAEASTLTVISAHLNSGFASVPFNFSGSDRWNDFLRAGQHDRLVDYAGSREGAVAVGVDANVSIDPGEHDDDPLSSGAVSRFEDEDFENIGDFSDGEPGVGTSSSGKSIDYIWARGVVADPAGAEEVDRGPSDHDGQVVDYSLPRW